MQLSNAPASSLHWKLLPGSLELNVKLAAVDVVDDAGVPLIVVSGGVVSTGGGGVGFVGGGGVTGDGGGVTGDGGGVGAVGVDEMGAGFTGDPGVRTGRGWCARSLAFTQCRFARWY